ncbi:hypothetical protein [Pseudoalteromonas sp.]|uniref:hypothetical protein n=1 Tax=Pseudoalteromonas sp. TaxID=53249 RepID=UPI003F9E2E9A
MAVITGYKNIYRVCAFVMKAIDRCFVNPEIVCIKNEYNSEGFIIEIDCKVIGYEQITVRAVHNDAKQCANLFLTSLEEVLNRILVSLTLTSELKKSDEDYIVNYSSIMMFKQIIKSL